MPESHDLLTFEEVAEILRVPLTTVQRLVREEKLVAKEITPHNRRIARADLDEYLASL